MSTGIHLATIYSSRIPRCHPEAVGQVRDHFVDIVTTDCVACLRDLALGKGDMAVDWRLAALCRLDELREARVTMLEAEVQRLRATLVQAQLDPRALGISGADLGVLRTLMVETHIEPLKFALLKIIDRLEGRS